MHLTKRGKRRLLLVVTIFMILAMVAASLFVYRDVRRGHLAEQSRAEGLAAHAAGDYQTALMKLRYPLDRNGDDVEALLAFADSRSKVVDANNRYLADAAGVYNEALKKDPDNLRALEQLLWIYGRLGYRVEGRDVIERILKIDPAHIDALAAKYALLISTLRAGEEPNDDPAECARRLMALQPDQIKWCKFLLEAIRLQKVSNEEMIALCDEWIDGYQGDGRFHLLKAETLLIFGRFEEAQHSLLLASRRGADSLDILDLTLSIFDVLSMQARSDEEFVQARRELLDQTKSRFSDQPWVYEAIIRQHWRSGAYDQARKVLDEARQSIGSLNDKLLRWKTLILTASNLSDEALKALDQLQGMAEVANSHERDTNRAWIQAIRARLTVDDLGWPVVIERLKWAIELSQRDPILYFLLAEAYQNIEENELAAQVYLQALRFDPLWLSPYVAGARALLKLGRPEDAIGVLADMLQRSPNVSLESYVVFAEAWLAAGRTSSAFGLLYDREGRAMDLVSMLQVLYRDSRGHPEITRLLLEAHLAGDDEDSAIELIRSILDGDSTSVDLFLVLAEVSRGAGLPLEEDCLQRALRVGSGNLEVVYMQAMKLHQSGQDEQGLALLDDFLAGEAESPTQKTGERRIRAAYLNRIEHPDAIKAMNDVLAGEPDSHDAALFVLSAPNAWRNRPLIERAIDQLARLAGEQSPRVIIARANAVLRYDSDDPARMAAALSRIGQVVERTPDSLPALTLMAELLLVGNNPNQDQAIRFLRTAVDKYPTVWGLYPRLIGLLQKQGQYDAAQEYLHRFGRRTENMASLRQAELKLLQVQGDFETIVVRLREALDTSISSEEELLLASMYLQTGQHEEAEALFTRLLAQSPDDENVVREAAAYFASSNQYDRALALLESFDDASHPARKHLLLGRFFEREGDLEQAGRHYRRAHELEADHEQAINQLARHLIAAGSPRESLTLLDQAAARGQDDESLRITRAMALLQLGPEQRQQAFGIIETLGPSQHAWLETERLNDRVLSNSGSIKPSNGLLTDARQLVEENEQFLPAWRLAVALHAKAGLLSDAVQLARRAAVNLPLSAEPLEWSTKILMRNGLLNDSLESARQWRQRMLEDPFGVDLVIASLLMDLGRYDEALQTLESYESRIVREPDKYPDRIRIWLRALLHKGQYDRALGLLTDHEQARELWYPLCRELDVAAAYEALQYAESMRGTSPREAYLLANEWVLLGQRADQRSHFDTADELCRVADQDESLLVPLLLLRAMIASGQENYTLSETYYRRALQTQPDHPGVMNNLAYALLMRNPQSQEALMLTQQAVQLDPENPDLLDTRAQALLGAERLNEAATVAMKAVSLRGSDPALQLTLTRIRVHQKRYDEAQQLLIRIQRLLNAMPRRDETLWTQYRSLQRQIQDNLEPVSSPEPDA